MAKLVVITALWRRYKLAELMLSSLRDQGMQVIAVGSEGKVSAGIAERAGAIYYEHRNNPVGRKWNHVLSHAEGMDCDGVVALGSDDFATPELFGAWSRMIDDGIEYMGILDGYVYDAAADSLRYWPGYVGPREGEPLGSGRCWSRRLLDRMGWKLWDDKRNRSLDGSLTRNIRRSAPVRWTGSMIELGARCTGVKVGLGISGVPDDSVPIAPESVDRWYGDGFRDRARRCV